MSRRYWTDVGRLHPTGTVYHKSHGAEKPEYVRAEDYDELLATVRLAVRAQRWTANILWALFCASALGNLFLIKAYVL